MEIMKSETQSGKAYNQWNIALLLGFKMATTQVIFILSATMPCNIDKLTKDINHQLTFRFPKCFPPIF